MICVVPKRAVIWGKQVRIEIIWRFAPGQHDTHFAGGQLRGGVDLHVVHAGTDREVIVRVIIPRFCHFCRVHTRIQIDRKDTFAIGRSLCIGASVFIVNTFPDINRSIAQAFHALSVGGIVECIEQPQIDGKGALTALNHVNRILIIRQGLTADNDSENIDRYAGVIGNADRITVFIGRNRDLVQSVAVRFRFEEVFLIIAVR